MRLKFKRLSLARPKVYTSHMTEFSLVYVTIATLDQARKLARQLLDEKLIACANFLPQMESIYTWKGEIESSQEVAILLKTETRLVPALTNRVEEIHEYETPCVLELKVESGSPAYLRWLKDQLRH